MFKRKTVLVVGAGASSEMGLPVGDQLKAVLSSKLDLRFENGYDLSRGDRGILGAIRAIVEQRGERDINPLCTAGRVIAAAMPQAISIDNFLHTHSDDPDIVLAGKLGIAASILEAENKSTIQLQERNGGIEFATYPNIWLNTFCKMICEGLRKTDLETMFENVSIVTFNYDRCIEHYLSHWIANYMQIPLDVAQLLTNKLTVIHPYGQVGKLPWQPGPQPSVNYGDLHRSQDLGKYAAQIRTFTERVEDEAMLSRMRGLISEAQRIVYLGFSYGDMNMQLLRLEQEGPFKAAFGTTYNMSASNTEAVIQRISVSLSLPGQSSLLLDRYFGTLTANQLLNDYWYTLVE
ncbi:MULTISPECIES: hypothetical protein [unclassified Rhizobium]|uniref:hypothetical protein n=1 Tax=unclassified Rhizobium TaxID=2613769 RepID=UPI001AD99759|nr:MULTISPECIES: hypothetical protein [unclassified Rhizobium]MBO9102427.1 hypothetical protein [Rhizobium sp. L58/93]MBO9169955.1 hypothetical protein [Rhizobium sp. L245/93]MBO9188231.1 hypothetical protein [Rhizobium sp. E27B/91]QXZ82832.1 hypothetical protein J5287_12165 [Rhizobium sp. K1/93]QXZ89655.1 hypothetical protein J5280_16425 [Rhizobium sp. K15/93]